MRSRTVIDEFKPLSFVGGLERHDNPDEYHTVFPSVFDENSTSSNLYSMAHSRWATMLDDISQPTLTGRDLPYKSCSHLNNHGMWISAPVSYEFITPCPAFFGVLKGYICPQVQPPPAENVEWDMLVDALAKQVTEATTSKFLGAVFLRELSQTVQMIRNPFGLFTKKMVRKLPRGITAHTASMSKKYASSFLEYRYGWRPLYSDVCEFSKILAHYGTRGDLDRSLVTWSKFRAGKTLDPPSAAFTPISLAGLPFSDSDWAAATNYVNPWNKGVQGANGMIRLIPNKCEYKANVTCEQLRPQVECASVLSDISNVLQISTWRQIRDTLWEVLPLSFVADWFVDFSSIWRSSAETDLARTDVRKVGYSLKASRSFDVQIWFAFPRFLRYSDSVWSPYSAYATQGPGVFRQSCSGTASQSWFQRTPGLPAGGDQVFTLRGMGILRALDGLSLVTQRIGNKKRKLNRYDERSLLWLQHHSLRSKTRRTR